MRALVTGGGGFVGGAIVRELRARGHAVRSLARGSYPELERLGVETLRGDLADRRAVDRAVEDADVVFHAAAKTGIWGARADYWRTNVEGTRNVLDACLAGGVAKLVTTSSPSVCFDGAEHRRAGNDLPYARRFLAHYPESKAIAERMVLAANGRAGLATCALRPHLVFGPGDPHLLPRLVERARHGKFAIIGRGDNEVSLCYIENAAVAHVLAAERLALDAPHAGRAYFIAQEDPVLLWEWIGELIQRIGLPPLKKRVSAPLAHTAGAACELAWSALRLSGEPPMTRFLTAQLSTSHSYDLGPAQRDFGYAERVGMEEALERSANWLRDHLRIGSEPGPSM